MNIHIVTRQLCTAVGKWFAEEEKKLAEVVYHLSGANPGDLSPLLSPVFAMYRMT